MISRLDAARFCARAIAAVRYRALPASYMGVVFFDHDVHIPGPILQLQDSLHRLPGALCAADPSGGTDLTLALRTGELLCERLTTQGVSAAEVVVFTDGHNSIGADDEVVGDAASLRKKASRLIAVGVGDTAGEVRWDLLEKLAGAHSCFFVKDFEKALRVSTLLASFVS